MQHSSIWASRAWQGKRNAKAQRITATDSSQRVNAEPPNRSNTPFDPTAYAGSPSQRIRGRASLGKEKTFPSNPQNVCPSARRADHRTPVAIGFHATCRLPPPHSRCRAYCGMQNGPTSTRGGMAQISCMMRRMNRLQFGSREQYGGGRQPAFKVLSRLRGSRWIFSCNSEIA